MTVMSTEHHALPVYVDAAELGTLLRRLRRERHLSIEALAFVADMHPTYLPEIERGLRNPSLGKLSDLALALGVPLSLVIREAERRTRIARIAESIERAEEAA
jgi:transcriptional regulator with XRE-family HTH domain